ncbi:hypothetical protein IAG44_20215 [Streptomyces roseirectus]|uniref:Uncharacterized protein n=1 Tax=Streptomyces roseirectus TaxID=2768066 RepID=A0A7H0IFF7_9ACTN|nr:hypothetical protein [Streptomyces roseirectus]QNP71523.1 hypothetical protein IAG44_20215 [Streptomyces roseirectus]
MNKKQRQRMLAEVHAERDRLLPLRSEASQTTIEMVRTSAAQVGDPDMVPYLNLAYILGVKRGRGDDALVAFSLSLANWAVAAIAEVARCTDRTVEQVVDVYETAIMAAAAERAEEERVERERGGQASAGEGAGEED